MRVHNLRIKCPCCGGSGKSYSSQSTAPENCIACNGTGVQTVMADIASGDPVSIPTVWTLEDLPEITWRVEE